MNWEKEIIKIIRADEYDHEDVGHNETTLKVCNFIREHFSQDDESRPVEKLVMPNERELIDHYNNEESQEWLNASLGKQKRVIAGDTLLKIDLLFNKIRNAYKGSIGSIDSHYLPQLNVEYIDSLATELRELINASQREA